MKKTRINKSASAVVAFFSFFYLFEEFLIKEFYNTRKPRSRFVLFWNKLTLLKRCLPYFKRAEQICFLETCCQKTKVVRACLRVVDITVCYVIVVPLLRCISTRPIFIFKLFSQQTFVSKKHLFGEHF